MPLESPARLGLLSLVAGGALVAGCAGMGGVQGRLEPAKSGRGAYENTVVYLVAKEPEKQSGHPKAEIVADGNGFTPDVLAVAVGTKVTFHNKDRVFHNAFSISPAKRFDVGAIAPGDRRTVVFDHAGVVSVFCELHPKASATIVVVPTRRFAMVDETGSFHFSGVPKGAYTLKSWHPDRGESKVDVQMPEHGDIQVTLPY